MPISKYFSGHGSEVMSNMKEEYGEKKGESVFYATANKRHEKPVADGGEESIEELKKVIRELSNKIRVMESGGGSFDQKYKQIAPLSRRKEEALEKLRRMQGRDADAVAPVGDDYEEEGWEPAEQHRDPHPPKPWEDVAPVGKDAPLRIAVRGKDNGHHVNNPAVTHALTTELLELMPELNCYEAEQLGAARDAISKSERKGWIRAEIDSLEDECNKLGWIIEHTQSVAEQRDAERKQAAMYKRIEELRRELRSAKDVLPVGDEYSNTCPACKGSGKVGNADCPKCQGGGVRTSNKDADLGISDHVFKPKSDQQPNICKVCGGKMNAHSKRAGDAVLAPVGPHGYKVPATSMAGKGEQFAPGTKVHNSKGGVGSVHHVEGETVHVDLPGGSRQQWPLVKTFKAADKRGAADREVLPV